MTAFRRPVKGDYHSCSFSCIANYQQILFTIYNLYAIIHSSMFLPTLVATISLRAFMARITKNPFYIMYLTSCLQH